MRSVLRAVVRIGALFLLLVLLAAGYILTTAPDPVQRLQTRLAHRRVTDRHDHTLRYLPDSKGDLCHPVNLDNVPEDVVHAFLAAEDSHFYSHPGLNPLAVVRAAWHNLRAGRVVSGGSTITQQLIRRIELPTKRSLSIKFREAVQSLRLEWSLSKAEILSAYLNLVPLGGQIEGIGLAAQVYFGKPVSALNLAEAAALSALPKAPGRFGRHDRRLEYRRQWVLGRMNRLGFSSLEETRTAIAWPPEIRARRPSREADHFVDRVLTSLSADNQEATIQTSLDLVLQQTAEKILRSHRERLARRDCRQAALVILDAGSMEILALVGSFRYGPRDNGYVDGTAACRSAGSVLKPFLYARALEEQLVQPCTPLTDIARSWQTPRGDYLPANADRQAHGPVTVRSALGNSLNLCAVHLLEKLGGDKFFRTLQQLQLTGTARGGADTYGLGMAIGNVEVTLLDLAAAYSVFTRGGGFSTPILRPASSPRPPTPIFPAARVAQVADILADPTARMITFGNPQALTFPWPLPLKTGTSTRYRDCWIVAVNPRHIIAIWAGNFSGAPTAGLSGSSACAPILKDLALEIYGPRGPGTLPVPDEIEKVKICGLSGGRPGIHCPLLTDELLQKDDPLPPVCNWHGILTDQHGLGGEFAGWLSDRSQLGRGDSFRLARSTETSSYSAEGPRILYPHDGDRFVLDPSGDGRLRFKAQSRTPHPWVRWFVDGREVARVPSPYDFTWTMTRGRHRLSVAGPDRQMDAIEFSVE